MGAMATARLLIPVRWATCWRPPARTVTDLALSNVVTVSSTNEDLINDGASDKENLVDGDETTFCDGYETDAAPWVRARLGAVVSIKESPGSLGS